MSQTPQTFTPREVGGPFNPDLYDPGIMDTQAAQSGTESAEVIQVGRPETTIGSLPDNTRRALATAMVDKQMADRYARLNPFFSTLINDCENTRQQCSQLRTARKLGIRYDRNDYRGNNRVRLFQSPTGGISETAGTGYAPLGLTQGWTAQAVSAGASYQANTYHERSERFFAYRPVGKKQENKMLSEMLTKGTEYYLRKGNFERHSRERFFNNFWHGTTFLRYKLTSDLSFKTDPQTGAIIEEQSELKPTFRVWPVRDIECTNRERGGAMDQQGVFWISRQINLGVLEKNEAMYDFNVDQQGAILSMKRVRGEYFNLGLLRKDSNLSSGVRRTYNYGDPNSQISTRQADKVSMLPTFDLIEYEGRLSYETAKLLHPDDARVIGLDMGMGMDWDYEDPQLRKEFILRLLRVPVWNISYLAPFNSYARETNLVLQMNPAPFGRNSLYVYRYSEDNGELDGLSISDIGDAIEAWGDSLRNAQVRVDLFNSEPTAVIDKTGLRDASRHAFYNLLKNRGVVEKTAGRAMKDFLELLYLQPNPNIEKTIQSLREMFFDAVGVLPAIMGIGKAQTLGQDKMNSATAQNRLDDNLLWNAKEDYRLIKDMMTEIMTTSGRQGFFMKMREITGRDAVGVEEKVNKIDDLWDQFYLDHPNSFGRDQTVLSRLIDEKAMLYMPTGKLDLRKLIPLSFNTAGYPFGEDLLTEAADILEPREEQKQMAVGNETLPTRQMDLMQIEEHIAAHLATMQQIEAGRPIVIDGWNAPPENVMALYEGLTQYLQKAVILRDMLLMQMSLLAPPGQQQNGPGGGGKGGPSEQGAQGGKGRGSGMMGGFGQGIGTDQQINKNITDSITASPARGVLPYVGV